MATKYQVTDSRGCVHKRTTLGRTYTHCVVTHHPATAPSERHPGWPPRSSAQWCGRLDLAHHVANRSRRNGCEAEIIEAVEVVR